MPYSSTQTQNVHFVSLYLCTNSKQMYFLSFSWLEKPTVIRWVKTFALQLGIKSELYQMIVEEKKKVKVMEELWEYSDDVY